MHHNKEDIQDFVEDVEKYYVVYVTAGDEDHAYLTAGDIQDLADITEYDDYVSLTVWYILRFSKTAGNDDDVPETAGDDYEV